MNTIEDGGPAFPTVARDGNWQPHCDGMTLRDHFAAEAMSAGLVGANLPGLADPNPPKETIQAIELACVGFYRIADAMISARKVQP
jgi:hypothetical protein